MHLFDFSEDIYDKKFTIELIDRLREEKKFNSLEELKEQLNKDKLKSISIINSLNTET